MKGRGMKKDRYRRISVVMAILIGGARAEAATGKTTYYGITSLRNETHSLLTVFGPATLTNVTVTGDTSLKGSSTLTNSRFQDLQVHGPLRGLNLTCQTLEAFGPVTLSAATVRGKASIKGTLTVNGGTFQEVFVTADEITLKDASLKSLRVLKNHLDDSDPSRRAFVHLEGTTRIDGGIIFEGNQGVVLVKSREVVLSGPLQGGTRQDLVSPSPSSRKP